MQPRKSREGQLQRRKIQRMTNKKGLETSLIWVPSILIAIFFIKNAFEKIFQSNEITKLGLNNTSIIFVGILLLIATALFLMQRTLILGAAILALYMTFVLVVHIYKGRPFILTLFIVLAILVACYLRKAKPFFSE